MNVNTGAHWTAALEALDFAEKKIFVMLELTDLPEYQTALDLIRIAKTTVIGCY